MKNIKKTSLSFFLLAVLFVISQKLSAVPAIPYPVAFTQPDGKTLTVMLKGDEKIHWHESMDGYTLLYNQDGYLTYAHLDEDGNLQPSLFIATDVADRDITTHSFLNTIKKKLFYSEIQKQFMLKVWAIEEETAYRHLSKNGAAVIGSFKTICAFVQFPEKSMIKTMGQFEGLMNQLGYTVNGKGSVRDFFRASSYNQFDLTITLCGVYTAPKSESYYAGPPEDGTLHVDELARWVAQKVAAESNINFRDYDSNNDGVVDGFHFIFAGVGQEAGECSTCIWSHKFEFSPAVTQNGKSINIYSCSPELLTGTTISTIGVICHEMTHAFGAPDFYDTNYETSGEYTGTGTWDIMASGSWNGTPKGNCPPFHNMYTKVQFGWVTPVVLSAPATINKMPNSAENPIAYRINTATNNEYYLLENRQQVKFDADVPGNGLFIYHVHSNVENSCINCTHPQRMYPVCASATVSVPNSSPSSYGNINSAGCPFPGTSNQSSFTDNSTPSMKSWANSNTNKPITNITHSNRLISFDFMGGGCPTVSNMTVNYTGNCEAQITWNAPNKAPSSVQPETDDMEQDSPARGVVFSEGFEGSLTGWTQLANSGKEWGKASCAVDVVLCPHAGTYCVAQLWEQWATRDAWLFSPAISLTAQTQYTITFWLKLPGYPGGNEHDYFELKTGNSNAPGSMTSTLYSNTTTYLPNWTLITATFTPTTTGSYYLGFHAFTPFDDGDYILVDDVEVKSGGSGGTTKYNVYRDGSQIATNITATSYTDKGFSPSQSHTWSVKALCDGGGESASVNITREGCMVGVEENVKTGFSIAPNPASNHILITAKTSFHTVKVVSLLGQTVITQPNEGNTASLNVANLTNGVYFVCIISGNGTHVGKFVKQ